MHEYSLIQSLLEHVDREVERRGAVAVHALQLDIGELAGVEVQLLRTAFEMARAGTCCEGAVLEIDEIPASWRCGSCDHEIGRGRPLRCPRCSGAAVLSRGGDLLLRSLEMEVP